MSDQEPIDRRKFFRHGLVELFKPLAKAIAPFEKAAKNLGKLDAVASTAAAAARSIPVSSGIWLRPPGAIAEKQFVGTCTRGGDCVRACPAECIKIDPSGARGKGVPFIDVDNAACVVCDGLHCMRVCQSGALVPTSINDINMGTAVWYEESCVRSSGGDCMVCVEECPLGEVAIGIRGREIVVNPLGCIGCGVCQNRCPTGPKSIVVIAKAAKDR